MRFVWLILLAAAGGLAGYLFTRFEGDAPVIDTLRAEVPIGAKDYMHSFRLSDEGAGIESVRVTLRNNGKDHELLAESYEGGLFTGAASKEPRSIDVMVNARALGLSDGPATLTIEVRDYSWRGNVSRVEVPAVIDTRPPRLEAWTGLTYVRRGGSEMAVYRVGEDSIHDGAQVGEHFFPGYPHPADPNRRIVTYAIPPFSPADIAVHLVAEDRAGNRSSVPLTTRLLEQTFAEDQIQLSERFMQNKVIELGVDQPGTVLEAYLSINRDMRQDNARTIAELCQKASPDRLWSGAFIQMPNSHVGARFAERRSYLLDGRVVDRQVHEGYDMASLARAAVPAANDGVVVFAGPLGIYGGTVILDHGLGLFSLYGHLSEVGVEVGTAVRKGDTIGRTGTTGLAGGDHLHFGMLVSGMFVDPIEWFDGRWIEEHLEPKFSLAE